MRLPTVTLLCAFLFCSTVRHPPLVLILHPVCKVSIFLRKHLCIQLCAQLAATFSQRSLTSLKLPVLLKVNIQVLNTCCAAHWYARHTQKCSPEEEPWPAHRTKRTALPRLRQLTISSQAPHRRTQTNNGSSTVYACWDLSRRQEWQSLRLSILHWHDLRTCVDRSLTGRP